MERFVWIGPIGAAGPEGDAARAAVRGLLAAGHDVRAADQAPPAVDIPSDLRPALEGPILGAGATVICQAPASAQSLLRRRLPVRDAGRSVACLVADETPDGPAASHLAALDEVWVPTGLARERLVRHGVPRARLHVIPPAIDAATAPVRDAARAAAPRIFVLGKDTAAFGAGASLLERLAFWSSHDLVDATGTAVPDPLLALEIAAAGTALAVASLAPLPEVFGEANTLVAAAGHPRETISGLGAAAAAAVRDELSPRAFAARVANRHAHAYSPGAERLAAILRALGLKTPEELLADSRSRVVLCRFAPGTDAWKPALRDHLARHGPADDVTLCLWAEADDDGALPETATAIQGELERLLPGGTPPDLQLVFSPAEHIPWRRVTPWAAEADAAV